MQRAERTLEIDAPVGRVFDLFSDFESFPRWMSNIKEVRYTGRRYSRWTADAPLGTSVEWEAETLVFEPDHRIVWRTVRGDVDTEGEVVFEETSRGKTLMHVVIGYDPPAGRLGALVARLFGTDPQRQLEEDLSRFADVAEGRSHREARRAVSKPARRPPPGPAQERREYVRSQVERRRLDAYDYDTGERHRDERGGYDPRYASRGENGGRHEHFRGRDDREAEGFREARFDGEERFSGPRERGRERAPRRRFDEALREARRSQQESMRRYREGLDERDERDERRQGRFAGEQGYDERRWANDDERSAQRRGAGPMARGPEDHPRAAPPDEWRHALTPRERELERARRRPDDEYSRQAFRRGVDKLMDEPPSTRWRRWEPDEREE